MKPIEIKITIKDLIDKPYWAPNDPNDKSPEALGHTEYESYYRAVLHVSVRGHPSKAIQRALETVNHGPEAFNALVDKIIEVLPEGIMTMWAKEQTLPEAPESLLVFTFERNEPLPVPTSPEKSSEA